MMRGEGWAADYWKALGAPRRDADAPLDLLVERTHGPHGTAWWVRTLRDGLAEPEPRSDRLAYAQAARAD